MVEITVVLDEWEVARSLCCTTNKRQLTRTFLVENLIQLNVPLL